MIDTELDNFISMLYEQYYAPIVSYCNTILDDDDTEGELCAMEVFDQARKDAGKLMNHPNLIGWLKKTAGNRVKRYLRTKSRRSKYEVHITDLSERYMESLQYVQEFDEEFVSDREINSKKDAVLEQLTSEELELYNLRFQENLTFKEIGVRINMSESATRMRCVRLELKIKELVTKAFE